MSVCFLVGAVLGVYTVSQLDPDSAQALKSYLDDFVRVSALGALSCSGTQAVFKQIGWLLAGGLLGLSAVGILLIPVLLGLRGFLMAYCAGCFVRFLGISGILPMCLVLGIPALLYMPGFLYCGVLALQSGFVSARRRWGGQPLVPGVRSELRVCVLINFIALIVCGVYETVFLPELLQFFARVTG